MNIEKAHEIVDLEAEINMLQNNHNRLLDYYDKEFSRSKELYNEEQMYLKFHSISDSNSYIFELHMPTVIKSIEEFIRIKRNQLKELVG